MSRKTFLLALTGVLLSFTSFNTASYAAIHSCNEGESKFINVRVNRVGFSPDAKTMYFNLKHDESNTNFYIMEDAVVPKQYFTQPIQVMAYLLDTPVTFCSSKTGNQVSKFELQPIVASMTNPNSPSHQTIKN